jgi:NAD+ synthase (glutamine-hydrolysing)
VTAIRIALAQLGAAVGGLDANAARIARAWQEAASGGADLVMTPELALPGYPPDDLLLSTEFVASAAGALERLAADGPSGTALLVGTVGPAPEPGPAVAWGVCPATTALANRAVLLRDGAAAASYAKMRLPNEGVFDEARHFVPGRAPLVVDVRGVRVGVVICHDLWVEDGPVALAAAEGAAVLVVLNASPYHRGKRAERERWVRHHARAHGLWVCYVNRVGGQDEVVFDGDSMVAAPDGTIVARGAQFDEDLVLVDLDLEGGTGTRRAAAGTTPATPPPDAPLGPDAELWSALVVAVRDYCAGNGFREAIVGLSGGIDSAVVAALAVDALGPDGVLGVAMPSPWSSDHSLADAEGLARGLGVRLLTLPIGPALDAVSATLGAEVVTGFDGPVPPGVAYENLQSRLRGLLLMALSNERGAIVLTTGNKSEYAVGYATLYGDMAGGFAPLKDVLKGEVYALARHRNRAGEVIPAGSLTKPPSAELRPGQLDADSLPDYPVLDAILRGRIEELRSIDELVADGLGRAEVLRVVGLIDRAEHKRRQAAPGPKVSRRAFGRERRVPITSAWDPRREEEQR